MRKIKAGIFIMIIAIIMPIISICVNAFTSIDSGTSDYRIINVINKVSDENDTYFEYEDE